MGNKKKIIEAALMMVFGVAYFFFPESIPGILDDLAVVIGTFSASRKRLGI